MIGIKVIRVGKLLSAVFALAISCASNSNPAKFTAEPMVDQKIVFVSDRDSDGSIHFELGTRGEIYLMNSDGTEQERLTNNLIYDYLPIFTPNGSQIIFQGDKDWLYSNIYVMDIDGGNLKNLTEAEGGGSRPIVSPDGKEIAYQSGGVLTIMNIDGTNKRVLTVWKGDIRNNIGQDFPHAFSPDGTKIVFTRGLWSSDIYVVDKSGLNITRLTQDGKSNAWCSFSPDGEKIAFSAKKGEKRQVFIMNSDGKNEIQLTNAKKDAYSPIFSSSKNEIAYISDTDLYLIASDGTNNRRLTATPNRVNNPQFSSDAEQIVFEGHENSKSAIYIVNITTKGVTRLTDGLSYNWGAKFRSY